MMWENKRSNMTPEELYQKHLKYQKKMDNELSRVQCDAKNKGYIYARCIDWEFSKLWFQLETLSGAMIYRHYFACKTLADLKAAITWVVNDTLFFETTAFVKGGAYVTFRSQRDIDLYFDGYYS